MYNLNELVRRTFYSLELKHQICKEPIENGLSLRDCVEIAGSELKISIRKKPNSFQANVSNFRHQIVLVAVCLYKFNFIAIAG